MRTIRRAFPILLITVAGAAAAACGTEADETADISDDTLLLAESCRDGRDLGDADLECIDVRDGRARVFVARDVRDAADDFDCARARAADRGWIFRHAPAIRRCIAVQRDGDPTRTCALVSCREGSACVDTDSGPMCEERPVRECDRDDACTRLCHRDLRRCYDVADRLDAADGDRVTDRRTRGDRVGDRVTDRPSDRRPHDRRTHDRVTDRVTDRARD
jgi:hypothetical protein